MTELPRMSSSVTRQSDETADISTWHSGEEDIGMVLLLPYDELAEHLRSCTSEQLQSFLAEIQVSLTNKQPDLCLTRRRDTGLVLQGGLNGCWTAMSEEGYEALVLPVTMKLHLKVHPKRPVDLSRLAMILEVKVTHFSYEEALVVSSLEVIPSDVPF